VESSPLRVSPLLATAKRVVGYGALCGLLLAALRYTEYRWLVIEHSVEIWGGLIAALFASLGIALGLHLTRHRVRTVFVPVEVPVPVEAAQEFSVDERRQRERGVTARELEILGLIADGLSNREIAERLFVSENTVKTHSSRLFDKLGARRRTQAVQLGREAGLLPGAPSLRAPHPKA
jgi:NarL family two-component system response regulator LiaR